MRSNCEGGAKFRVQAFRDGMKKVGSSAMELEGSQEVLMTLKL